MWPVMEILELQRRPSKKLGGVFRLVEQGCDLADGGATCVVGDTAVLLFFGWELRCGARHILAVHGLSALPAFTRGQWERPRTEWDIGSWCHWEAHVLLSPLLQVYGVCLEGCWSRWLGQLWQDVCGGSAWRAGSLRYGRMASGCQGPRRIAVKRAHWLEG